MSKIQGIVSIVSGLLFMLGFVPYIIAILCGETKPAKATWIIWLLLDVVTLLGMYAKNAVNYQIWAATIGAGIVVVLAIKYGKRGWTKLDIFCLTSATLGLALWQIFSNPVLAILISLVVSFIGSAPTFVSTWQDPSREDRTTWTLFWLSCVLAILAIPAWTLADAAQPIVFFSIETVMMFLLFIKPRIAKLTPKKAEA